MEAPPYSPTVLGDERLLPHDYICAGGSLRAIEDDVLASLRRDGTSSLSPTSTSSTSPTSAYSNASTPPSPTSLLSTLTSDAPPPLDPPPSYTPLDALARSFRLDAPFVYTTRTSCLPRYQFQADLTRGGKPAKLSIRRLLPAEARSRSISSGPSGATVPKPDYDDTYTLYACSCTQLAGKYYTRYEMRGQRSGTLDGIITFDMGVGLTSSKSKAKMKVWHSIRNTRRDALDPANEARMRKYGYRAEEEWDRRLLFSVKKGVWRDSKDKEVAREAREGEMRVTEVVGGEGWKRDLVVSCWVVKAWMTGAI